MPTTEMAVSVKPIKYALEYMASLPEYTELKQEVASLARTTHGGFTGDKSCLNVLVEWARDNGVESLKPFWRIADPEHARLFPDARKTQYQGSYMQQRRERQRRALQVLEMLERRRLRSHEKEHFKKDIQALWMYYRDQYVSNYRPGAKRNEAVANYWKVLDEQIETALNGNFQAARQVLGRDEEEWLNGLTPP